MKLIVITPDGNIPGEGGIVNQLFNLGMHRLHLRKTGMSRNDMSRYINTIDKNFHARVVIHSHYDLCREFHLGGIHLNSAARTDPNVWDTISQLSPASISTSFHSWNEISENDYPYNYVFISPVFNSISKPGYLGSIDLAAISGIRESLVARKKYCPDIVGLGGIDRNNIGLLAQHGFDGAALLGAVWQANDPTEAFRNILDYKDK